MSDDKSEHCTLRELIDRRINEILGNLRSEIVAQVREALLADFGGSPAPTATPLEVPPGPLTPEGTKALLDRAVSEIGEARGIARTADGKWACAHCQRVCDTQRAATMHAKVCRQNPEHVEPFGGRASWAIRRRPAAKKKPRQVARPRNATRKRRGGSAVAHA